MPNAINWSQKTKLRTDHGIWHMGVTGDLGKSYLDVYVSIKEHGRRRSMEGEDAETSRLDKSLEDSYVKESPENAGCWSHVQEVSGDQVNNGDLLINSNLSTVAGVQKKQALVTEHKPFQTL